jgi:AcrR family transcriptional regulator
MKAALELVGEHGFHGAPMALVAERAGVAAGTIYRYFESKDVMINEIYYYLEGRFFQAVMTNYPEGDTVRNRFLHIGGVLVRYCINSPLEARFLEQFRNSPYGDAHRREKFFGTNDKDIIFELFSEAAAAGITKPLPLAVLFSLAFSPLMAICGDHIRNFVQLDEETIDGVVRGCWDAIRM